MPNRLISACFVRCSLQPALWRCWM